MPATMRVRLRTPLAGVSAGVRLSRFQPGVIYDVDARTGAELVTLGAEIVPSALPASILPERALLDDDQLLGGVRVVTSDSNGTGQAPVSGGAKTSGPNGSSNRHRRRE
jgi:hypothetical protein